MRTRPFKAGGALTDEHAAIYIERQADHEVLLHLRVMDYLLVIEPRQQGKTSLINHLMRLPALDNVAFVYVDVTTPDRSTEATWYQTLCSRILRQLRRFVPRDRWPVIPQNSAGWREFLSEVAILATDSNWRVVIALDEIGAVTFPSATEFFSVLRDVYNSRQAEPEFKQLTFLLTGAFHPRDLIKDDKISPFNIAHRVRLADFTLTQVGELVGKGIWTDEQVATLAERVHYWTDGQPYLTQLLCSYLDPNATSAAVDVRVEQLRREDENHLPPLLERLNSDEKLRKYVDRILAGEPIKFYPRENRRQAQLELLGVIKADEEGYCIIRNQLYVQALDYDVPLSKAPQILLNFTSPQSLIEKDWESYGREGHNVRLRVEYDPTLGKRVLVKEGHGFDAAVRYKASDCPPLDWRLPYYELVVRLHPESAICLNVLDSTGKDHTLLYSSAILPLSTNEWGEFHIPLDKDVSDGFWHPLLIDLPEHMEQAHWPSFVRINWLSLRGEVALAGIRGCDDEPTLRKFVTNSPYSIHFSSVANNVPKLAADAMSQSTRIGEKNMDYKRGFRTLKECLSRADSELQAELAALEDRFWKNERAERVFGSSENTRNERAQIVFSLNELAWKHCHVSFNELCQGVEPKPSVSQPMVRPVALPPRSEQAQIRFKLQIARLINLEFEVRALETPMGEPRANGRLPYTEEELVAVLKALQMSKYEEDRFTPNQRDMLKRLELPLNPRFVSDLPKRVGEALYQALMVGEVNTAFQMALNQARTTSDTVALQLRFDEDAVQLARYPWELLYHRRALLPSRAVEFTRYISYPEAVTVLPVTSPLQLLYIQARPTNLSRLPDEEQTTVRQALNKLEDEGIFKMEVLSPPTYDALLDYLEAKPVHILHFDGHGVFARQCPECGAMNYPHHTHCQARQDGEVCGQEIAGIEPLGYLAFETETGHVDWISSEILGNLLYNRSLRLAVLSACRSSEVGGETLFGGVAPALIQTGVPAVVSTQLPISVDVAVKFMQGFYRALSRFESVPAAVNAGRLRVMQTREWFIPALYLRSQDDEGYLFAPTQGG